MPLNLGLKVTIFLSGHRTHKVWDADSEICEELVLANKISSGGTPNCSCAVLTCDIEDVAS